MVYASRRSLFNNTELSVAATDWAVMALVAVK